MKFTVVSAADASYQELQRLTSSSLFEYANCQGYQCAISQINYCERPASWYKIPAILKAFSEGCDYAFWVDCDAILVNKHRRLESFLHHRKHLYISQTSFGPSCGVMMLKNSDQIHRLLDLAWQQVQFINHPWWEQQAIIHLFNTRQFDWSLIHWIPEDIFNCEWYWSGALVYHMPNTPNKERMKRFRRALGLESSTICR